MVEFAGGGPRGLGARGSCQVYVGWKGRVGDGLAEGEELPASISVQCSEQIFDFRCINVTVVACSKGTWGV